MKKTLLASFLLAYLLFSTGLFAYVGIRIVSEPGQPRATFETLQPQQGEDIRQLASAVGLNAILVLLLLWGWSSISGKRAPRRLGDPFPTYNPSDDSFELNSLLQAKRAAAPPVSVPEPEPEPEPETQEALDFGDIVDAPTPEATEPPPAPAPIADLPPETDAFAQLALLMANRPTSKDLAHRATPVLNGLFPGGEGAIYMFRPSQGELQMLTSFGGKVIGPDAMHPSECRSFSTGKPLAILHPAEGICQHFRHRQSGFSLCSPIKGGDDYYGIFCVHGPGDEIQMERWKRLAEVMIGLFGIYLIDLDLREKFQVHSIRDPLTGMFNRRYMEESLVREVSAAHRRSTPIGLILVHPDNIQNVRSEQGTQAADQLLWEIGQRLPNYIRAEDIACRFDGDVLSVLLPGAGLAITEQRSHKILAEISGLEIAFHDKLVKSSISVGFAVLPVHGANARNLVSQAEQALMLAGQQGGNRVVHPI